MPGAMPGVVGEAPKLFNCESTFRRNQHLPGRTAMLKILKWMASRQLTKWRAVNPSRHPPTDYSVTLPEVIDFHRKNNPSKTVYVFSEDGSHEPTNISYLEFGRAADRVAHYIRPGRSGPDSQVIAFVALSDTLLYQAVTIGITRAPYPMSPRNTAASIIKLLKDTSCHRLLTTYHTLRPLVDEIRSELTSSDPLYAFTVDEVPPVQEIFPKLGRESLEDPFEEYPHGVRPPIDDILLYLHSSGSTGFPKTIPQTFKSMVHWASFPSVTDNITYKVPLTMAGHALPAFHTLGIVVHLMIGLYAVVPIGLFPPVATTPTSTPMMPIPHNVLDHITRTRCNCLAIIPTILQMWAQDKKAVDLLASLEFVVWSGGPLPSKLGNFMTESGVYITPAYGATEFGSPTCFFRREGDEKDWEYLSLSDRANIRWDPQGDGTFESQFLTSETHQVSVENLPDVKGYASSDLWVQHPTNHDVIVHTSGEKTVPAPMEDILMSSPYIMGVTMFGRERDQAGVLIELKPPHTIDVNNETQLVNIRNTLWPIVEEANKIAPAFSRIFKEMILIASRDKPLPRAGKGTVMRKAALLAYQNEIDDIYAKVDATVKVETVVPPPSWNTEDTVAWLQTQVQEIHSSQPISVSGDLFQQGMDSLSVTILRRRIVSALQSKDTQQVTKLVTQATIYSNPPSELCAHVQPDRCDRVMIAKYTTGLSQPIAEHKNPRLLLTGSTGNLGAQLLESLVRDPRVKTVYVLNRPSSGPTERFADKGLDVSLLSTERLVYLEGEASHRNLGLRDVVYNEVRTFSFQTGFNVSLSSFEPNVQAHAISWILLGRASTRHRSSSYSHHPSHLPSLGTSRRRYAVGNGYGEILAQSGLQATSLRIGQISGGHPNGAWATSDWVPILVKSSLRLNALPTATGVTSWIPMDAVSQTILDVVWSAESPMALNVVHPRPIPWTSVFSSINEAIVQEGILSAKLQTIDFQTWVSQLEVHADNASTEILNHIPAIKLLDFFRATSALDAALRQQGKEGVESGGFATFSTAKAQSISRTMQMLPTIGEMHAQMWVKYWKVVGFL
ncbi:hypothetical protein BDZ97DRAFT_1975945 [Flammula alnicola]|nr:hypothetical protein BDZ97DRAFT_1975945 [Flammula alnicola]